MSNQLESGSLEAQPCVVQHISFESPFERVLRVETWPPSPPSSTPIKGYLFAPNVSLDALRSPFVVILSEVSARGFGFVLVRAPWHKGEPPGVYEVRWSAYGRTTDGHFAYHRHLIARALHLLLESDFALTRLVSALAAEAFLAELIEEEMLRQKRSKHEIRNATATGLEKKLRSVARYRDQQYKLAKTVISQYKRDVGEARDMLGHGTAVPDMDSARLAVVAIKAASELILAFPSPGEADP